MSEYEFHYVEGVGWRRRKKINWKIVWPDYNGYQLPVRVDRYQLGPLLPTPELKAEQEQRGKAFYEYCKEQPGFDDLLAALEELGRMVDE